MKRSLGLAAALVVLVAATQATAQNLLNNPGFEDPTVDMGSALDNWFRFGSGANGTSVESTAMPRSGARHIDLDVTDANQFAGVFQLLGEPVAPGQKVIFTGWHKNAATSPFNATVELKLEWQGMPNPPQNRIDLLTVGNEYEQFMHMGVAPAGTTGLVVTYAISSFGAGQGTSSVFVDDFQATIIPEPATMGMAAVGLLALCRIRRRR